jgi:periplasmic divalent cation tolerance protein
LVVRSELLDLMDLNASECQWLMAVTTAPSAEVASALVRELVSRGLVACGTVLPGSTSIYRWKGTTEQTSEAVVLLKTTGKRWAALCSTLPALHPYEVPELIAVPIVGGHQPYLDWLRAETGET